MEKISVWMNKCREKAMGMRKGIMDDKIELYFRLLSCIHEYNLYSLANSSSSSRDRMTQPERRSALYFFAFSLILPLN